MDAVFDANSGQVLKKKSTFVKPFMSAFKGMVNKSHAARVLWSEIFGGSCPGLAEKLLVLVGLCSKS
jgi:hypothetical protein